MSISTGQALARENQKLPKKVDIFSKGKVLHHCPAKKKLSFLQRFNINPTLMRVVTMGFTKQKIYLQQLFSANENKLKENFALNSSSESDIKIASYKPESHGFTNRYNQLPCDLTTRRKRIDSISQLVKKNAKILLLGDDDLVSVELARENFSAVHVADCDRVLLETIHHYSTGFAHQPTLHEADFTRHDPKIPACNLILLDPANHLDSILDFGRVAIKNQLSLAHGYLMIMINPLLIGEKGMESFLLVMREAKYEVVKREKEFNFYPVNLLQKMTLHVFWFIHLRKRLSYPLSEPCFFTSDCFLFEKR